MSKNVTLTIDGKQAVVPEGTLIVDAAKSIGINIPVFCYHPKMEPVGMCRMCLVEIGRPIRDRNTGEVVIEEDGSPRLQFGPKLETACTVPVSEGMVVIGLSEKVLAARDDVLEFLLTSHPLDCPVCDKGDECPLQNLTMAWGPGESRYPYEDKKHLAKHYPLGELIVLDRERCIQCGRCVRFQDEIVDDPVIGFYNRGRGLEIVTFSEPGFDSYFSGNTTDICPVGALTTSDFRFGARPWEMQLTASICPHCPVGCNVVYNVRREARSAGKIVIKRAMPRQNEAVNEIWMCDKGRFAYHYMEHDDRLTHPLVREHGELQPASWDKALGVVADRLKEAGNDLLALGSGRLSNEDLFNLSKLAHGLGGQTALYTHMAGGDLVGQVGVGKGTNFADMGPETAILVVASDLEEEAPIWWLRVKQAADRGAVLIVLNPRPTKLDRYASLRVRYEYGSEATTILALVNALSAKRPDLPGKVTVSKELKEAAQSFAGAENAVILYGSEGIGLKGSQILAQACTNLLISTDHIGKPNNGLIGVWARANEQGAWDMGFRPLLELEQSLSGVGALYIVAADPVGDDPALQDAVKSAGFLVVQELFLTETARLADVILPAQSVAEREGTFTSGERRVQRFYPAVPVSSQCQADFTIVAEIGKRLGLDLEAQSGAGVMSRIAQEIPAYSGLHYRDLAQVEEQWPIIGLHDLYYGGTAYSNTQGLGVQLQPTAQRGESVPLGWLQPEEAVKPADGLSAVPVTRLYDRGITVLKTSLLHQRIVQPYVAIHPEDAQGIGAQDGTQVALYLNGKEAVVQLVVDEAVPMGVLLVPRSVGIPLEEPSIVKVTVIEGVVS
jgi:NADH-quinone oxidoreductase subunit G